MSFAPMRQPEDLMTDAYQPWSRGRGTDVWAMIAASCTGDVPALQALVTRDPGLADCEYHYYRPLYFAVRENQIAAVRYLLSAGADPMVGGNGFQCAWKPRNPDNLPWPFDVARERGFTEVLALLDAKVAERCRIVPEGEAIGAFMRAFEPDKVRDLLDARPDLVDAADGAGNQPLHWAVMTRQLDLVDDLLARGADIDAMRPDGARPLDVTNGDYHYRGWRDLPVLRRTTQPADIMRHLLAKGADYDVSTAARLGDIARVRALLDADPGLANRVPPSTGYYNGAPLRNAAGAGHLAVVELLLERGADPSLPEPVAPNGGALYEAIAGKHWDIVTLLLHAGANPNAPVESSGDCVWRAKRDKAPREIQELLAAKGGVYTAEMALYDGDIAHIAKLLAANPATEVWPHLPTDNAAVVDMVLGYQPDVLRKMVFGGAKSAERARWLFAHGMDPARPNWLGITPLHRFAATGNTAMAEVVLEHGVPIDPIDSEYDATPLGWATRLGRTDMAAWLRSRGAAR